MRALKFWFPTGKAIGEANMRLWFGASPAVDQQIREAFLPDLETITAITDAMVLDPETALATTILLDQFPRNIFRGTDKMFAYDHLGLELAKKVVQAGVDKSPELAEAYGPSARAFFYLPFEHSEALEDQEKAVKLYEELEKDHPGQLTSAFLKYAVEHRDIVKRFGRFPHRNAHLKRQSTDEETRYLAEGGQTFGTAPTK